MEWGVAGFIGAMVGAWAQRKEMRTRFEFAAFMGTGAACAYFLTGLVAGYFSIEPANAGAVGFLLGAFGGSMIAAIVRAIQAADLWALIKSKVGR